MTNTEIRKVQGRRVWDSRGRPTVEVEIELASGATGRAIAPAGASTGTGEALDLRDGGSALAGLGINKALTAVNGEIAKLLVGRNANDQADLDHAIIELDGTPNRSRLGGNASVATSMALLHAAAAAAGQPIWRYLAGSDRGITMPLPEIQIFGGGAHAARRVDVQDFMVMCPAASTFAEALEWTAEVYRAAGDIIETCRKAPGRGGRRRLLACLHQQ
ncbi:phosphopyruvate hydratase family protein [Rhizobium leguminosarum]